jgi:low affinity Fe/Cu permease
MNAWFARVAGRVADWTGSSWAFIIAALVVIAWIVSGPLFGFSDTWQLVINTGTTIVTFLMVFLIQNTQNRDTKALHLKLDELLRALPKAREREFMDLELRDEQYLRAEREKLFSEAAIEEVERHEQSQLERYERSLLNELKTRAPGAHPKSEK